MNLLDKLKAQKAKTAGLAVQQEDKPPEVREVKSTVAAVPTASVAPAKKNGLFSRSVPAVSTKLNVNRDAPQGSGGGHPALVEGANFQQRLLIYVQKLQVCQPAEQQDLLLSVVSLMTEIMQMEHEQVGTAWNQQDRGKYDIPVLGEALKLVADRFNKYAVHTLEALVMGPEKRLHTLSNGEDPRHVAHVIAAAAQLIADEQVKSNTTKATQRKREDRLTEGQKLMMATIGIGDGAAGSVSDDPFAAIFDADIFVDASSANKEAASALNPKQKTASVTSDDEDAEPVISSSANLRGKAAPAARGLFASRKPATSPQAEAARKANAAGDDAFSLDFDSATLGQIDISAFDTDDDEDEDDPFASL